jgi:hypothetical protein
VKQHNRRTRSVDHIARLHFGKPVALRFGRNLAQTICAVRMPHRLQSPAKHNKTQSMPAAQLSAPVRLCDLAARPCVNFLSNSSTPSVPSHRYGIPVTRRSGFQSLRYLREQEVCRFDCPHVHEWSASLCALANDPFCSCLSDASADLKKRAGIRITQVSETVREPLAPCRGLVGVLASRTAEKAIIRRIRGYCMSRPREKWRNHSATRITCPETYT